MFEIGASEILLIAIAALIAIGPQDLPEILFRLGRLVRRIRIMTNSVRDQYSEIMHDAEMAHYRKEFGTKLMDKRDIEREIDDALAFHTDRNPNTANNDVAEEKTAVTPVNAEAKQEKPDGDNA